MENRDPEEMTDQVVSARRRANESRRLPLMTAWTLTGLAVAGAGASAVAMGLNGGLDKDPDPVPTVAGPSSDQSPSDSPTDDQSAPGDDSSNSSAPTDGSSDQAPSPTGDGSASPTPSDSVTDGDGSDPDSASRSDATSPDSSSASPAPDGAGSDQDSSKGSDQDSSKGSDQDSSKGSDQDSSKGSDQDSSKGGEGSGTIPGTQLPAAYGPADLQRFEAWSGQTWVVERGQTLSGISATTGASVGSLVSANEIVDPNLIWIGQELEVPDWYRDSSRVYEIQPGDTLGEIAQDAGTTVDRLAQVNDVRDPNRIIAGATLWIP